MLYYLNGISIITSVNNAITIIIIIFHESIKDELQMVPTEAGRSEDLRARGRGRAAFPVAGTPVGSGEDEEAVLGLPQRELSSSQLGGRDTPSSRSFGTFPHAILEERREGES